MFSSHTVLSKVLGATGLFRAVASALRQQKLIVLILTFSLLAGASVVAARRVTERRAGGKSVETAITPPFPPAIASHLVTPVGSVLSDVSSDSVTTISAAAFGAVPFVAPESIVSAFGLNLASQIVIASDADPNTPGTQLPTELAGTSVEVNGRKAGLFFVSPSQINYVIPAATTPGSANVVVKAGTTSYTGTVQVTRVAPAIFTANSNGSGVPAALILRASGLQQRYEQLSQFSSAQGKWITKPIDMGPSSDRLFLILYVSGVRQAADDNDDGNQNEKIRVLIGGVEITPAYVAPQTQFVGLEQINVEIPRSLIGQRNLSVAVAALDYGTSNVIDIELVVPTTPGPVPPQLFSFGGTALAGNEFVINGMGFSPVKEENEVHIGSRLAKVTAATTTQLTVMAPYGVESSAVSVRTTLGEGKSSQDLAVRTSVSGVVENTARVPLAGVAVRLCGASGSCDAPTNPTTSTSSDGAFVLPVSETDEGVLFIEFDGTVIQNDPPYPKVPLTIITQRNRDNQFPRTIALQQSTGSSGTVGGGSLTGGSTGKQDEQAGLPPPVSQTQTIQTGGFQLQFPTGVKVNTPSGATSATLNLTAVENSRTPVQLPYGYYSTSIVQITPFNVKFDPGAKLIFPNTDEFPAGMPLVLYRYDPAAGKFVQEKAAVAVSEDGQRIETAADAIKISSYYFASSLRNTTTATGYVLDSDGKTPVQNALVRCRGQEFLTDSNGSYLLRYVAAEDKEIITVEVSTQRNGSRVDRVPSVSAPAVVGGLTRMPNVIIPDIKTNRPPTIQRITAKQQVEAGKTLDVRIDINDPDIGQSLTVTVSGASFATIAPSQFGTIASAYTLKLAPNPSQGGEYTLTITASDSAGGVAQATVVVYVIGGNTNPQPTAVSQSVTLGEDTMVAVRLDGSDANGAKLSFKIVSQPANGSLSGDLPNLTYKPGLNFNGTDRFTFLVTNGLLDSEVATVTLNVRPVNDAPILTVPEAQTVNKGQQVSFAVLAFDPDTGDKLAIGLFGTVPPGVLPPAPVSANSWQFRWTPMQAGTYTIGFRVTDNGSPALSSDTKEVRITVNDVSLLSVPGAQVINEGQSLSFDVAVVQNVTGAVTIESADKPSGATLSNPVNNSAQFRWTPGSTQSGVYNVSFKATVAGTPPVTETKQVQIIVIDVVRDLAKESASVSILGAAGRLPLSLSDDGDLLGSSVATGDLNGDGIPDLAIGAPGANGLGFDNGKVYVFFGSAKLTGSIDLALQKADVEILGEAAGDRFGTSLAIADLNGDGKNDLIIGAPKADGSGLADAGKVYAIFDNMASGSDSISRLASLTIIGSQRGEGFGTSVAAGFLHTRPGSAADLIVGAPGFDAPSTAAALSDVGAAYVFFGSPQLTKSIELSKTPASYKVTGTFVGGMAGTKVAVGNFNGDDYADFAISAPSASASGLKLNGAVFLGLGGPAIGGEKNISQASSLTLFGGSESDLLGSSLAMGDLNGDGRADLILSAIGADGPENSRQGAGHVYVLYGTATLQGRPPDLTIYGSSAEGDTIPDALGTTLAVGDFNGDGVADLAIGAPGADNTDPKRDATGAVYVIYGARSGLTGVYDLATKQADWTAWGARSGDNLGIGSIAIGNINASEPADIILGIPKSSSVNNTRTNAGEVRIVYGIR
ncbi:MAG: Ig-like domain-containing protein [Acidobacteriota bacterium]